MAEPKWIPWVFLLEAVVIVTGNVTVLVIFTRTPSLRKRKYYLLVSLAVADLLVGLISLPMYVTLSFIYYSPTTYENKQLHSKVSIVYNVLDILFGTASVFGLAAVAIERVYAVYFPFKHRTLTKGTYIIGISVVWVMAVLFALCRIFDNRILLLFTAIAPIIISLILVIISYSLIWIKMNCMSRIQDHAIDLRDRKMTVTVLMITIVSLIAWIPFQVLVILSNFCPKCLVGLDHTAFIIFKFLQYSNSLVNPIIYALRMPQFKKALFNQLHCCTGCYSEHGIDNRHNQSSDNLYNNSSCHDANTIESHNYHSGHDNNSSDHGNNSCSDHYNSRGDHDINRCNNANSSSENSQNRGDHEKCMKYDNISSSHGNNDNNKGDHNRNLSNTHDNDIQVTKL